MYFSLRYFMFKGFIIIKYFHIQTLAIKRKYPTLIVRIFLVSARTHSLSRYIHIQILCVHKRNVLRFLQHGTYHVVVRGGSRFCQSPKGGGVRSFFIKTQGRANTFLGKNTKIPQPSPPPPRKNVPSLTRFYSHATPCQLKSNHKYVSVLFSSPHRRNLAHERKTNYHRTKTFVCNLWHVANERKLFYHASASVRKS